MSLDVYDKVLKKYLQSKIVIKQNNRTIRTGKLTLFNIKQYFIKLYIETEKKELKTLELPYPYTMSQKNNFCIFNYHLSSLCNNHTETMSKLCHFKRDGANKLYDSILEITRVD